jgi:hypothetical protein
MPPMAGWTAPGPALWLRLVLKLFLRLIPLVCMALASAATEGTWRQEGEAWRVEVLCVVWGGPGRGYYRARHHPIGSMVSSTHEHHEYCRRRKFALPVTQQEVALDWDARGFTVNSTSATPGETQCDRHCDVAAPPKPACPSCQSPLRSRWRPNLVTALVCNSPAHASG